MRFVSGTALNNDLDVAWETDTRSTLGAGGASHLRIEGAHKVCNLGYEQLYPVERLRHVLLVCKATNLCQGESMCRGSTLTASAVNRVAKVWGRRGVSHMVQSTTTSGAVSVIWWDVEEAEGRGGSRGSRVGMVWGIDLPLHEAHCCESSREYSGGVCGEV